MLAAPPRNFCFSPYTGAKNPQKKNYFSSNFFIIMEEEKKKTSNIYLSMKAESRCNLTDLQIQY